MAAETADPVLETLRRERRRAELELVRVRATVEHHRGRLDEAGAELEASERRVRELDEAVRERERALGLEP